MPPYIEHTADELMANNLWKINKENEWLLKEKA